MVSDESSESGRRIPSRRELRARVQKTTQGPAEVEKTEGTIPSAAGSAGPDTTAPSPSWDEPRSADRRTPRSFPTSAGVLHSRQSTSPRSTGAKGVAFASSSSLENTSSLHSKRRGHAFITLLVIALIGVLIWGGFYVTKNFLIGNGSGADTPLDYEGAGTKVVTVEVPEGASGTVIANILFEKKVVASKQAFISALSFNPESTSIQPGVYSLKEQMNSAIALNTLLDSSNRIDVRITIPEGFQIAQLKERLIKLGGYTREELDTAFSEAEKIGLPPEANGNPEGWLAPGTYAQKSGESASALISRMVKKNTQRLENLKIPRDQWLTVLTKSSIAEREMSIKKYLPQVARVIDNRLDEQLGKPVSHKLQMDSTVSYGVGRISVFPTKDELQKDTPYNTYIHEGLPPGPIAVAGDNAIEAVLHPAEGDWLYFVTTNLETGETAFAATYEEFLEAKAQLKQYCEEKPGKC